MNYYKFGFKAMLPIVPGVLPFGLIMGTIATNVGLNFTETMGLNSIVFAGASQLAAIDLMEKESSSFLVILTCLVINLRFILYSAAFAPILKNSSFLMKSICAYLLTDQSYAVSIAHDDLFDNNKSRLKFFLGNSICMMLFWHFSVFCGIVFGNIAPKEMSLDFAVPLSFMALTVPSLKTMNHKIIAVYSLVFSCIFYQLPFNLGLLATGLSAILIAIFLTRKKV